METIPILARLLAPRRRKTRDDVAGRALEVIAQVLRDVGIDRFLNGSLVLDRALRLRFVSAPPPRPSPLAQVAVRELPEAVILRAYVADAALDAVEVARHSRFLADGLMRELLARCPELRALPASRPAAASIVQAA